MGDDKKEIEELIDAILRTGARRVPLDAIKGQQVEVIKEYSSRGWNVREEEGTLLFENNNRKLLKG